MAPAEPRREGEPASGPFPLNLFRVPLRAERAHYGQGLIQAARVAGAGDLAGPCNYIDYAELPPGTSIGDHRHAADEEEYYLVLSGNGTMRLGNAAFGITAGDLVRNPPGGVHGLANTGDDFLRLFIFELCLR